MDSHEVRVATCTLETLNEHREYPANTKRNSRMFLLTGTACGHLDETIFTDELMTGYVNSVRYCFWLTPPLPPNSRHTHI